MNVVILMTLPLLMLLTMAMLLMLRYLLIRSQMIQIINPIIILNNLLEDYTSQRTLALLTIVVVAPMATLAVTLMMIMSPFLLISNSLHRNLKQGNTFVMLSNEENVPTVTPAASFMKNSSNHSHNNSLRIPPLPLSPPPPLR
jgi:hypothetical protein